MLYAAWLFASVTVANGAAPSSNVTVPFSTPPDWLVTAAVYGATQFMAAGFTLETNVVVVGGAPTLLSSTPTEPAASSVPPQLLLLLHEFATTKSGLPSPFTSPTATPEARYPPEM